MRDTINPLSRHILSTGIGLAAFLAVGHTMTDTFDIRATPPYVRQDVSHVGASTVDRARPVFRQVDERI